MEVDIMHCTLSSCVSIFCVENLRYFNLLFLKLTYLEGYFCFWRIYQFPPPSKWVSFMHMCMRSSLVYTYSLAMFLKHFRWFKSFLNSHCLYFVLFQNRKQNESKAWRIILVTCCIASWLNDHMGVTIGRMHFEIVSFNFTQTLIHWTVIF